MPTGWATTGPPLLVLFHGLEARRSHYAQAFADWARHGWRFVVPHFRGCSGELNRAARLPLGRLRGDRLDAGAGEARHGRPPLGVGVSLGGNALLRWAEEAGDGRAATRRAVAAISSPIDLAAGGHAIGRGFNRLVYTRMFLRTMKPRRWSWRSTRACSTAPLLAARDLYEFDDVFTAPLHGFRNTDDYWARGSAKPHLPASASRRWCSTRATIPSCRAPACRGARGRLAGDAVAARAWRATSASGRALARPRDDPARRAVMGWIARHL